MTGPVANVVSRRTCWRRVVILADPWSRQSAGTRPGAMSSFTLSVLTMTPCRCVPRIIRDGSCWPRVVESKAGGLPELSGRFA